MNVTSQLWKEFETFWFLLSRERVDLTLQEEIFGKLDQGTDLLNSFIILLKLHIWVSRKQSVHPNLNVFKEIVKLKVRTAKNIVSKNYIEDKFQARWQPYLNSMMTV